MASGNWAIVATPDVARLKRSYERNVGHSRFWAGVGTAILGGLLLFITNTLWEIGKNPQIWTPLVKSVFSIGIFVLGQATVISFALAWTFRNLYRSDDAALTYSGFNARTKPSPCGESL